MIFESTWEIGVLMHEYYRAIKLAEDKLGKYTNEWCSEKERIEDIYCQAIELSCNTGALVMPIDMAVKWVDYMAITDDDGHGYLLDQNGEKIGGMCCNIPFLSSAKNEGSCFVEWYNK